MTPRALTNVAASVRQRLLNRARNEGRASIRHTFVRRGTPVPTTLPEGLTASFAEEADKLAQWKGFVRKSKLDAPPLADVVAVAAELAKGGFAVAREEE